jgi:hypothetical protein
MFYLITLKSRSEVLFYFGALQLILALLFLLLSFTTTVQVAGVNAWFKPFKFAASIGILSLTIAWLLGYLHPMREKGIVEWGLVISLGLEIIYIAWRAYRGEASHFNVSTPFNAIMYGLMAAGATFATLMVGIVAFRFFAQPFPELHPSYLLAIRAGLVLFVIFSFQGFAMGSRMAHTVGAADGGPGIPILNWSTIAGDLRIAHFMGMHALQILPLLAVFLIKSTKGMAVTIAVYALVCLFILTQALKGEPLLKRPSPKSQTDVPR